MLAMGWKPCHPECDSQVWSQPFGQPLYAGDFDANFIVEKVIPWANERGIELHPHYRNGYWLCGWNYPKEHADAGEEGGTLPEAVFSATAEALRAEVTP